MADIVKLIYKGDEMSQGGGSTSVDQATENVIGTVRIAKTNELRNGTATGSNGEYLVPSAYALKKHTLKKVSDIKTSEGKQLKLELTEKGQEVSGTITMPETGFFSVGWTEQIINGHAVNGIYVSSTTGEVLVKDVIKYQENSTLNIAVSGDILAWAKGGDTIVVTLSSTNNEYSWDDVITDAKKAIVVMTGVGIGYN